MCGIFYFCGCGVIRAPEKEFLEQCFNKIQHRGPDESKAMYLNHNAMMGFHRLGITDPKHASMQPFTNDRYAVSVNGEIYNYEQIYDYLDTMVEASKFQYTRTSKSDCEAVLHLWTFLTQDIEMPTNEHLAKLCRDLDGEYAIVIYEPGTNRTYVAVDQISCRPLFVGTTPGNYVGNVPYMSSVFITSEQKALVDVHKMHPSMKIERFPAGHTAVFEFKHNQFPPIYHMTKKPYFDFTPVRWPHDGLVAATSVEEIATRIRELLVENVRRKLRSDRQRGYLLSGGLDSSLVCGIAAKLEHDRIRTYTIGFSKDAPDVVAARKVAEHINSIHTEFIVTYEEGKALIPEIIYGVETWDQTTIRASTPMALLIKRIRADPTADITVLYSGEVADELFQGYMDNHMSPGLKESRKHQLKRLFELPYYDGERADRVTAYFGSMELRLPFFGKELFEYILSLPVQVTDPNFNNGVEKWILRKAFEGQGYIPDEIIWRTKNAFSDATSVSVKTDTNPDGGSEWKTMLRAEAETQVMDSRFSKAATIFPYKTPQTKEDMWYREEFDYHRLEEKCIPDKWMPAWAPEGHTDSSATSLQAFKDRAANQGI